MTFDPAQPYANQSPSLFPAANHDNMARIQDQFDIDHQFNNTTAPNDGWHKVVHWQQQSGQIDPLNPLAAAPTNAGGPPITWEQEDVYNVPRVWIRHPNNGNVQCMDSSTEIRGSSALTPVSIKISTPPANTIGTIILYNTSLGIIQEGVWVNDAGVFTIRSNVAVFDGLGVLSPQPILLGNNGDATGVWAATGSAAYNGTYIWRIYYRYL